MSSVPQIYKVAASAFITIVTTTMAAAIVLKHSIIVVSLTRVDMDNSMLHKHHSDHADSKRDIFE